MRFSPAGTSVAEIVADSPAQVLEPETRPGEFDTKYRETYRYDYQRRTRRNNHNYAKGEHGTSDDRYSQAPRDLVGQMKCFLNHR